MVSKAAAESVINANNSEKTEMKHSKRVVSDAMKLGRSPKTQALLDEIDKISHEESA